MAANRDDGWYDSMTIAGSTTDEARRLLTAFLEQAHDATLFPWDAIPAGHTSMAPILAADAPTRLAVALGAVKSAMEHQIIGSRVSLVGITSWWRLMALATRLLRGRLPATAADTEAVLSALARSRWLPDMTQIGGAKYTASLLRWSADQIAAHGMTDGIHGELIWLRKRLEKLNPEANTDRRKGWDMLNRLLDGGTSEDEPLTITIDNKDDWGFFAGELLAGYQEPERSAWIAVLAHAATAESGAKPSAKWLKEGDAVMTPLGAERFRSLAAQWFTLLDRPTRGVERQSGGDWPQMVPSTIVVEKNSTLLRGLAWLCSRHDHPDVSQMLGDAAVQCFRKIPNIGARSTRGGNACVWALGELPGMHAAAQLQRLEQRIKYQEAQRLINAAFVRSAERAGLSRDDLDDLAVPAFDLADGRIHRTVGSYQCEVSISGATGVQVQWTAPDGQPRAAEPAALKREHAAELKAVKRQAEELKTVLVTQARRLEHGYLTGRTWTLDGWRQRLLDHPLLGHIARRLIWTLEQAGQRQAVMAADDRLIDAHGAAMEDWTAGDLPVTVRLWHPIDEPAAQVLAWRLRLEALGLTQPFKQAHREVYLLTDAERQTEMYSNRFAAHILRQHQFATLCRERGWTYKLQGMFDNGGGMPALDLPSLGLRAEYWVEAAEAENPENGELTHSGIFRYVSADQVRFLKVAPQVAMPKSIVARIRLMQSGAMPVQQPDELLPLRDIAPVVFSEVMRDVDLFVGVCSVGNDPNWLNGGVAEFNGYWQTFAFGDLGESAKTRRALLERLLPRLAIAARCSLTDKFLVVRGDLRTYKIHLGSGNILMEPNDQYLCIVPDHRRDSRAGTANLLLPFEGDGTLSVIVSKAFLLADDTSITDTSITNQIK